MSVSLITRKFARQSHAVFTESRNAAFHRLRRGVRLGSIPIARSTFRCLAGPCVALGATQLVPTPTRGLLLRMPMSEDAQLAAMINAA